MDDARHGLAHVGVVVAGHEADPLRGANPPEEGAGGLVLVGEADVDEVAGHRDMIDLGADDVVQQPVENVHAVMLGPAAAPVEVAGQALAHEVAPVRLRQGADVRIGEVGDADHGVTLCARRAAAVSRPANEKRTPTTPGGGRRSVRFGAGRSGGDSVSRV